MDTQLLPSVGVGSIRHVFGTRCRSSTRREDGDNLCKGTPVVQVAARSRGRWCRIARRSSSINIFPSWRFQRGFRCTNPALQKAAFFGGGHLQSVVSNGDPVGKLGKYRARQGIIRCVLDTAIDSDDEPSSYDQIVRKQASSFT